LHNVRIQKSNILPIGPSGSGITHLVGLLASYLDIPLVIGGATSLTETGYVGDDVESLLSTAPGEARRLPVIAPLDALGMDDLARILTQPKDSLIA
jgi:ATP-dependent protease Clp ATPase subunit